jgi:hypothetical protein
MISMGLEIIGENKNPMISTVAVTMDFRGGGGAKNLRGSGKNASSDKCLAFGK